MTENRSGRSQSNTLAWVILAILIAGAVALGLLGLADNDTADSEQRAILREMSNQRLGGGRLYLATSNSPKSNLDSEIQHAQLSVLPILSTSTGQRIQSLIFLAQNEPQKAIDILQRLRIKEPNNVEILNDMGVAYMSLGAQDPLNYFKALTLLEQARGIAPDAAAPQFNLVSIYRAVGLTGLEAEANQRYQRVERAVVWRKESETQGEPIPEKAIDDLRAALEKSTTAAERMFDANPEIYRRAATDYALNPLEPAGDDPLVGFIMERLQTKFGDRTIAAMLAPLGTLNRDKVIRSRQLVHAGTDAYFDAKLPDSLKLYQEAESILGGVDSTFDRLWVQLNRADVENRIGNLAETRTLLDNVIRVSKESNLQWILGLALASKGSALPLADNFADHLHILSESQRILSMIAASRDSARPLYYAAIANYIAGNLEDSLRLTFRALGVTPQSDTVRRTQLFWLAGALLYRFGYQTYAIPFEEESVVEARKTANLPRVATATSNLAAMYEATLHYDQAEHYLPLMRELVEKIDIPIEKRRAGFSANVVCGRIYLRKGNAKEASECLQANIDIFATEPNPLRFFLSESLLLLAKVHAGSNRPSEARKEFRQAIDVVEADDNYLATEKLRLGFENERRDLYDSAITFEYDQHDEDTAWSYAQRYRSKLFLEFLGQTNPSITQIHSEAIDRDKVQRLIPNNMQIVEYVMLSDRLLIWLISDKVFTSRSIPISRATLDGKVSEFIEGVRNQEDILENSQSLYGILIAPIENLLDPNRTIAIIPDQSLHRLPFAALHSAYNNSYLISQYALVESPNLTHLLAASSATPSRNSVVSFGARSDDASTARELSDLDRIYPNAKSFRRDAVDKTAFLASMKNASIFHYAGHSEDASDPLRSSVLLDGSREGPNSVTAVDISQQKMRPNSVVVLASCDSSVGNSRDGIGMRGLTSAFLISGAGSVVGSLWPVETNSTSDLVIRFHEAFAMTKTPVAQALRQAQLSFLKTFPEKSHPYYWSGFVVTGNSSALR